MREHAVWGRWSLARWALGVVALSGAAGCESCHDADATRAVAAPGQDGKLEPWTLGAARTRDALVLPPPCVEREPALKTVLGRSTRVAVERHTLGRLWAAEGPSGGNAWHPEASGIVEMLHGQTRPALAPWPDAGPALVASWGDSWQLLFQSKGSLYWWDGERRELPWRAPAQAFHCDTTCAAITGGTTLELHLGSPSGELESWRTLAVGDADDEAVALTVADGRVVFGLRDPLRARFFSVDGDGPAEPLATLGATPRLLAALAWPRAMVMTEPPFQLVDGCASEGGVNIAVEEQPLRRLRAAEPPTSGQLAALEHGVLILWLAPLRCRSRRRMLYAAMMSADGEAVGPVTTVGETDAVYVATLGDDVDLWLHSESENTIQWIRARCR